MRKKLVIIFGPTGVGKTDTTIELAKEINTEIISCDSRQFYRELKIGTAVPTDAQLAEVKHHLIGNKSVQDYYNVYQFEHDALAVLEKLFIEKDIVLMTGGSGLYVDAMINGIDLIPDIDNEIRSEVGNVFERDGIAALRTELKFIDPDFYHSADLQNHKRLIRAIEVFRQTGKPYSSFRKAENKLRNFEMVLIGVNRDRQILYDRINKRVEIMIEEGLLDEVKENLQNRDLNALNTVGYKEIFAHLDGEYSLERAVELIQRNSRRYAKKQLTWFSRYTDAHWFSPDQYSEIITFITHH